MSTATLNAKSFHDPSQSPQPDFDATSAASRASRGTTKKLLKMYNSAADAAYAQPPILVLEDVGGARHNKTFDLYERIKVGRATSSKTTPMPSNGFFDSKVLSRSHAEVWAEDGKVFIRDVGSSNGTFVNGTRLSEENQTSAGVELHTGDRIEFGVDIMNDTNTDVLFKKVAVAVRLATTADVIDPAATNASSPVRGDGFTTMKPDASKSPISKLVSKPSAPESSAAAPRVVHDAAAKDVADMIAPLQAQIAKGKKMGQELTALRNDVHAIQSLTQPFNPRELEDARRKALALERELGDARRQLADLNAQVIAGSQEKHRLGQDIANLQAQISAAHAATAASASAADRDAAIQIEALTNENRTLNLRIDELVNNVNNLEAQLLNAKAIAQEASAAAASHQSKNSTAAVNGRTSKTSGIAPPASSSSSVVPIIAVLLVLVAIAVYLFQFGGLAVADGLTQQHLGFSLEAAVRGAQDSVAETAQKLLNNVRPADEL
ncbi:hypothetical protein H9P43_005198 [Blastocladiella emersonii ATCC 22665]|nr:hypothetical protein H9P43_005198 [Blastocladiella emersonii ATCC 22665]